MTANYPSSISLFVTHADSVLPLTLARAYVEAAHDSGLGGVSAIMLANSEQVPGDHEDLYEGLERIGPEAHYFWFLTREGTRVMGHRSRGTQSPVDDHTWHVEVSRDRPTEEALLALVKLARATIAMPEFHYTYIARDGGGAMEFVPLPPLARSFHLVTTNEAQVAERYDDPQVFWRVWETVEQLGELRLCIRHLDALEEEDWLARTFDDTMELARHALPKLTWYAKNPGWYPGYAPWWEPGDPQDEKAGYPALTFVGYTAETRTLDYTGFVARGRLHESDGTPRHVLIKEIHEVQRPLVRGKTREGQPVDTVRVVFAEEWMARQERRPLLDVGARVFYADGAGGVVEVVD